jgi:hypothetical protein
VNPQLDERARIDQQVEPFPRRQLVGCVLPLDLLGTSALLDLLAAGMEILGERT